MRLKTSYAIKLTYYTNGEIAFQAEAHRIINPKANLIIINTDCFTIESE